MSGPVSNVMGRSDKCASGFHRTSPWLPSRQRRRHVSYASAQVNGLIAAYRVAKVDRSQTFTKSARARAKLTIYQPLAVERLSYKQRPVIRHWINPTIDCTLGSARVLCHRTDTPAEPLRTSDPRHSPPDSQFHVIYDIATTLKLRRRHFV